jgi:hypothetical protein
LQQITPSMTSFVRASSVLIVEAERGLIGGVWYS